LRIVIEALLEKKKGVRREGGGEMVLNKTYLSTPSKGAPKGKGGELLFDARGKGREGGTGGGGV